MQESMYHSNFQYIVNEMDINWKFWKQFVFEDMLAYICLYLAIRSGCWEHGQTALQHHNTWLDSIRQCIWDRIQFENGNFPNTDALYRHWK